MKLTAFNFGSSARRLVGSLIPGVWCAIHLGHRAVWLAAALLPGLSGLAAETNQAAAPGWLTQPMSLTDAVTLALLHNSTILKSQRDLEAAYGIVVQTRAVAMPKVRGSSGYAHEEAVERSPITGVISPPRDQWSGSLRLVQTIYEGGRLRSALRAARLITDQAVLQNQAVVADTLLEVRKAYFDVLLAEQQIQVQEASVKSLTEQLENRVQRFEAGTVPRFDVLRSEVELANVRPRLIRARNTHRIAKNDLANLLGFDIPVTIWEDVPLTLTEKLEATAYAIELPEALMLATERRPELGVLRKEEALRREDIITVKSAYKPSISIFAGYGAHNSTFHDDFLRDVSGPLGGVELHWDLYDGGATKGRVMEAKARFEKAGFAVDEGVRRVHLEVRTAHSRFLEASEVLESQKKVQEQGEEALRLAIARYDAGTGTQLDVLNAQTALTEARTTQATALHNYAVAKASLERAIGQDVPRGGGKPADK